MTFVPISAFCHFEEQQDSWMCKRCGLVIKKTVHPELPFAACPEGAKQLGIEFSPAALAKKMPEPTIRAREHGQGKPGSVLKRMLAKIGIVASAGCSCNQRAAIMDSWGPDLCEKRLDTHIVPWLREESTRRGLPFVETVAKLLVRRAISKARAEAKKAAQACDRI